MTSMQPPTNITKLLQPPKPRLMEAYFYCLAAVLFVTATIKVISAFGSARILDISDPLLGLTNRWVYLSIALIEISIALLSLNQRFGVFKRSLLLGWLGSSFLVYRSVLYVSKLPADCPCLGNAVQWFPSLIPHQRTITNSIALSLLFPLIYCLYHLKSINTQKG